MRWNIVGAFIRNNPFGTEIAFRKGLERIGETVNAWDPSVMSDLNKFDPDADVTLIFKWLDPGVFRDNMVRNFRGKKIIYQVDDLRFPHIKTMMQEMRQVCDHALTFDSDGARLAKEYGYRSAQRMLLTADNLLYRHIPGMQKDIDVSFIGSLSSGPNHASRTKMLKIVQKMGLKLVVANEIFDIGKICEIYNRSKVVLNHATDVGQPFGHGFGYQCRHFEAGFSGACVLSNVIDNDDALKHIYTFCDEKSLVMNLENLTRNSAYDPVWDGQQLLQELNQSHLPEHRAREMVKFVQSLDVIPGVQ